jgi:hypothetical protein
MRSQQALVQSGGTFFTQYHLSTASPQPEPYFSANFQPFARSFETFIIYGINASTDPIRPFNRADYYISNSNVPSRCAPGTGVLIKSVIEHDANGTRGGGLPLLDCVADMQLVFAIDTDDNGVPDKWSPTLPATADEVRTQVKEVRVYILAHEGQKDTSYTYPNPTITLTDPPAEGGLLSTIDLNTLVGDSSYVNYRWKIYTLVVKPFNLR